MSSEEEPEDKEAEQAFLAPANKAKEEHDPFMKWFEQETKGNPIDFDTIPASDVRFSELIRKTIRCSVAFTDILRTEGYIYSYENFVERMPIFSIFSD